MIGLDAMTLYSVSFGFGKHFQQTHTSLTTWLKTVFIFEFFYNIGLTLAKLSVVLFYARCFGSVSWSFRLVLFVTALAVVAWGIIFVFLDIFTCTPVRRAWDISVPGHCIAFVAGEALGSAISNVAVDVFLLLLPMPMLWPLQMSTTRKVSLAVAFALGYWYALGSLLP